jgi:drug/metabolite transporter (DMT)-like permease
MKLKYWMATKAIVEVMFGIGFVVFPGFLGELFGMSLNESAELMARLFGTAFIFGSVALWLGRNASKSEQALDAIVVGVVVSNVIGFVVTLMASISGVWNALGWLPVGLYLVFGIAFAYFLFNKAKA